MKRITLTMCAIITIAICSVAKAQSEAEMKKWMDYMTPGDVHKMVSSWDGTWTGEISVWMAPNTPATKSVGTAINKMVLGGRYQVSNHTGEFGGMPFEGQSTLAYDNIKKVFESVWIDNMGTGVMHLTGPWDAATKTISLTGKMLDPMSGKEVTVRETLKVIDDNTQVIEMYAPGPDGKEYKTMEIKSTRKK
jgi:hypothetical protein